MALETRLVDIRAHLLPDGDHTASYSESSSPFTHGFLKLQSVPTKLVFDGVGRVTLPLGSKQAERLAAHARTDLDMRSSSKTSKNTHRFSFDTGQVQLHDSMWTEAIARLAKEACATLGVNEVRPAASSATRG
jgi:hypothetical protein